MSLKEANRPQICLKLTAPYIFTPFSVHNSVVQKTKVEFVAQKKKRIILYSGTVNYGFIEKMRFESENAKRKRWKPKMRILFCSTQLTDSGVFVLFINVSNTWLHLIHI